MCWKVDFDQFVVPKIIIMKWPMGFMPTPLSREPMPICKWWIILTLMK